MAKRKITARKRKIDISSLDAAQIDVIAAEVGEKTREVVDRVSAEVNKYLNIYGLKIQVQAVVVPVDHDIKQPFEGHKESNQ